MAVFLARQARDAVAGVLAEPDPRAPLRTILEEGYTVCHAGYDTAYTLQFLSDERVRFIPFHSPDRNRALSAELRANPEPQCLVTDDGVVRRWLPSDAAQEEARRVAVHRSRETFRTSRPLRHAAACAAVLLAGCGAPPPAPVLAPGVSAARRPRLPAPGATCRELRGVSRWRGRSGCSTGRRAPGLPTSRQKGELVALLDTLAALNANAVIIQVRPAADALYPSTLEPWSEVLTGTQGVPPEPLWDPLAFAIESAHARGLELHAWINPFRAGTRATRLALRAAHHVQGGGPPRESLRKAALDGSRRAGRRGRTRSR